MLKRILNSKMYLSSNRKSSILAAFQDPLNKELIIQISSYLNEDDLDDINKEVEETAENQIHDITDTSSVEEDDEAEKIEDDELIDTIEEVNEESDINDDIASEDTDSKIDKPDDTADIEDAEDTIEESTSTQSTPISASVNVSSCMNIQVPRISNELKGLLNSRQDTNGVARVVYQMVTNEFWVYYEDRINLNNVMNQVIELLNAAGYTYLQFNRLARTDNAIVFQYDAITSQMIVPVSKLDEE